MKLNIDFLENNINLSNDFVCSLEIENKNYFYRIVNILNQYSKGVLQDEIYESNIKTKIIIDYFNLEQSNKKVITHINKIIKNDLNEIDYEQLNKYYQKMILKYEEIIKQIDIPLEIDKEFNIDNLSKIFNISINYQNNILNNLFTLIDINKETKEFDLLVFINLKLYLTKEELKEFYKYAIYNKITILLVDSNSTGVSIENEKKIIIDQNLEEFMI